RRRPGGGPTQEADEGVTRRVFERGPAGGAAVEMTADGIGRGLVELAEGEGGQDGVRRVLGHGHGTGSDFFHRKGHEGFTKKTQRETLLCLPLCPLCLCGESSGFLTGRENAPAGRSFHENCGKPRLLPPQPAQSST